MTQAADPSGPNGDSEVTIQVPEIRDYREINAGIVRGLDAGADRVRLIGASGQRLLAANLAGTWRALIEVFGDVGPEVGTGLDAPGLTLLIRGASGHGAGSGLRAGRLILNGSAGDLVGYAIRGGSILLTGRSGHRLGARQMGGLIVSGGASGRLASERQSGGVHLRLGSPTGPDLGHGRSGGHILIPGLIAESVILDRPDSSDRDDFGRAVTDAGPTLPEEIRAILNGWEKKFRSTFGAE